MSRNSKQSIGRSMKTIYLLLLFLASALQSAKADGYVKPVCTVMANGFLDMVAPKAGGLLADAATNTLCSVVDSQMFGSKSAGISAGKVDIKLDNINIGDNGKIHISVGGSADSLTQAVGGAATETAPGAPRDNMKTISDTLGSGLKLGSKMFTKQVAGYVAVAYVAGNSLYWVYFKLQHEAAYNTLSEKGKALAEKQKQFLDRVDKYIQGEAIDDSPTAIYDTAVTLAAEILAHEHKYESTIENFQSHRDGYIASYVTRPMCWAAWFITDQFCFYEKYDELINKSETEKQLLTKLREAIVSKSTDVWSQRVEYLRAQQEILQKKVEDEKEQRKLFESRMQSQWEAMQKSQQAQFEEVKKLAVGGTSKLDSNWAKPCHPTADHNNTNRGKPAATIRFVI